MGEREGDDAGSFKTGLIFGRPLNFELVAFLKKISAN
jgi:hypothetical protein